MTKNDDSDNSWVVELYFNFLFFSLICIFKMFYSVHVLKGDSDSTGQPMQRVCKKGEYT